MSEETIQNPQAPLTLTNEIIVGQAFLPVHLARRHDTLFRPVGTYLRDVPSYAPDDTVEYGHDGNMLTYGGWTLSWNGENRLVNASNTTTTISNAYDYMGRRAQRADYSGWNGSAYATANVARFVWDGWNLLAELDAANAIESYHVWGLDLSGTLQGAGGIGGLLAMSSVSSPQSSVLLYTYDGNGNVCDVGDAGGSLKARYEYDPFGRLFAKSGPEADNNKWRFSTKMFEADWGLYYYGYRFYSPELGRWMSRDPIGERGGMNTYAFCLNSSAGNVDLFGLHTRRATIGTLTYIHETVDGDSHGSVEGKKIPDTGAHRLAPQLGTYPPITFDEHAPSSGFPGWFVRAAGWSAGATGTVLAEGKSRFTSYESSYPFLSNNKVYLQVSVHSRRKLIVLGCCESEKLLMRFTGSITYRIPVETPSYYIFSEVTFPGGSFKVDIGGGSTPPTLGSTMSITIQREIDFASGAALFKIESNADWGAGGDQIFHGLAKSRLTVTCKP
jgi:RHS repeat-associated protein